jgi:hypothetical protein
MAGPTKKIMLTHNALTGAKLAKPVDQLRTGMPAPDSVLASTMAKAKGGAAFTILHTSETDTYEDTPPALQKMQSVTQAPTAAGIQAALAASKAKAPTGDNYAGVDRKAAKLAIGSGKPPKNFADVASLIKSLPSDASMKKHKPPLLKNANFGRVKEEQVNIHVKAFLYAASREADNDFHLIIGQDPKSATEVYMTMEVSGLPPNNSPAFAQLNAARTSFKQFFGTNLPGLGYDFYNPPRPVEIEGSVFFDITHATGQKPGPPSLKSRMPTIWEVHPVTSIKIS